PVPRHAAVGPMDRRAVSYPPRDAHRARRAAQGQRRARYLAGTMADRAVHGGGGRHRGVVLSRDAGVGAAAVVRSCRVGKGAWHIANEVIGPLALCPRGWIFGY